MNNRERLKAVMHYENYDRMPVVHFGYWPETLEKWHQQGYLTADEARNWSDIHPVDELIGNKLGFDFGWGNNFCPYGDLYPRFETKILQEHPDGSQTVIDDSGVVVIVKPGVVSIPTEVDHLLKDRASWEEHYLPRLQYTPDRVFKSSLYVDGKQVKFDEGGLDFLKDNSREQPRGLHCGSMFGVIRNWLGLEGVSYLHLDDEQLYDEIIDTVGNLCYECVRETLKTGAIFDYAIFWEDICFKSGPLVIPRVFEAKVGPYYKRITDLLNEYGIDIVSLDCDGCIDALVPIWLKNGVNTMFPIEVGTWNASIAPWRQKYGKELKGVGGMDKRVLAQDYAAVDAEIERLKPLVELGGYIPCPDHRIPPDAKWENVQYYCDKIRSTFA